MNIKNIPLTSLKHLGVGALLLAGALGAIAADNGPDGLWKWTLPGRNGGPERLLNLELKVSGEELIGKIYTPNRTNSTFTEVPIKNGQVHGKEISFETIRGGRNGGNGFVTKYHGELTGDAIVGQIVSPGREGNPQTNDWKAERNATGKLITGPLIQLKPGHDELGRKIVNETHFKEVTPDEAEKYLQANPDAIILDTRSAAEYAAGHLPHAENHSLTEDATYLDELAKLDKSKKYVVHSAVGHYRTVRALEYFEAHGFKEAIAIDGGYNAWVAAGKPSTK